MTTMDNIEELEKMLKENKTLLDQMEPEKGHAERFMDKYDTLRERKKTNIAPKSGYRIFWRATLIPVAASLLLIFGVSRYMNKVESLQNKDFFALVENPDDPYAIYSTYMREVGESYTEISKSTAMLTTEENQEFLRTLANITDESQPMIETLPEEMSDVDKAQIVRDYYNDRLNGVETLKKSVIKYFK